MRAYLVLIVAITASSAQTPPDQPAVFKTGTSLVPVDVQVIDHGKPLTDLKLGDFVLRDDGVPRKIESFGVEDQPVQLMLVLDVSGSMGKVLREMASVGQEALKTLQPADQVGVVLFARNSRASLELTNEKALAARALKEAPLEKDLGAGTSLNDAVLDTTNYLRKQPPWSGRRAMVLLTDNKGMHFRVPDDIVVRALSETNTVLSAIVPADAKEPATIKSGAAINPDFTPANVFKLAELSGGEVQRTDKTGPRFVELMERLRQRYMLGVKPAIDGPGKFHKLDVELTPEIRKRYPKAEVHARAGYFTPEDDTAGTPPRVFGQPKP